MTTDEFWNLLDGLPVGIGAENVLEERLADLAPEAVFAFQTHFDTQFERAYQVDLWKAGYLIDGGCSDDGFTDFRYGLISRGREVFESAVADPDSLADVIDGPGEFCIPNEAFGYVALSVYKEKTGLEMPLTDVESTLGPRGTDWDESDARLCAEKFPRLWALCGEESTESAEPAQVIGCGTATVFDKDGLLMIPLAASFVEYLGLTAGTRVLFQHLFSPWTLSVCHETPEELEAEFKARQRATEAAVALDLFEEVPPALEKPVAVVTQIGEGLGIALTEEVLSKLSLAAGDTDRVSRLIRPSQGDDHTPFAFELGAELEFSFQSGPRIGQVRRIN